MKPLLPALLVLAAAAAPARAQVFCGTPGPGPTTYGVATVNNLTLTTSFGSANPAGNQGSGAPNCIKQLIGAEPDVITLKVSAAPGNLVGVLLAWSCWPSCLNLFGGYSIDIGSPANLLTDPFLNPLLFPVPVSGFVSLVGATNVGFTGPWLSVQAGIIGPGFPLGVGTSQPYSLEARSWCPGGNAVILGDDASAAVSFASPTPFPFYGAGYTGVHVSSNGGLTFGAGDTNPTPTEALMIGPGARPRIAAAWTDLDPTSGGRIRIQDTGSAVCVAWDRVMAGGGGGGTQGAPNTVCATLVPGAGDIVINFGYIGGGNGPDHDLMVGISPGPSLPNAVDFTALASMPGGYLTPGPVGAYEFFPAALVPFDLQAAQISFYPMLPGGYAVTVN